MTLSVFPDFVWYPSITSFHDCGGKLVSRSAVLRGIRQEAHSTVSLNTENRVCEAFGRERGEDMPHKMCYIRACGERDGCFTVPSDRHLSGC